jgi:hypothetical protein
LQVDRAEQRQVQRIERTQDHATGSRERQMLDQLRDGRGDMRHVINFAADHQNGARPLCGLDTAKEGSSRQSDGNRSPMEIVLANFSLPDALCDGHSW